MGHGPPVTSGAALITRIKGFIFNELWAQQVDGLAELLLLFLGIATFIFRDLSGKTSLILFFNFLLPSSRAILLLDMLSIATKRITSKSSKSATSTTTTTKTTISASGAWRNS